MFIGWGCSTCIAQTGSIFLFEQFVRAKVHFKNNAVTVYPMNYDANAGKMYFTQQGEMMEMTGVNMVDTIAWGDRKFIPEGRRFREVQKLSNGTIYIDWLIKEVHLGKKGVFGLPSQGSIQNLRLQDFGGGSPGYTPYNSQSTYATDMWKRKNDNTYYIQIKNKWAKIKTVKHLIKLFPAQKEQIPIYAKENDTDMKDVQDALSIINYCLGL